MWRSMKEMNALLLLWMVAMSCWKTTLQQDEDEVPCEQTYELQDTLEVVYVTSPLYPQEYPARQICSYTFKAISNHRLKVVFNFFDLERTNNYGACSYDYLEIHDGVSQDAPSFGVWCGEISPPHVISSGTRLFILFVSDGSIQEGGFSAEVTMVDSSHVEDAATPDPGACYQLLEAQNGFFNSPGFPEKYENFLDCVYVITPESATTVQLRFLSFDLEPSFDCVYDYVEVRDGNTQGSLVLGRYCGGSGNHPPDIIESVSGSSLYVHFHTDYSQRFSGFNAEYIDASIGFPSIGSDLDEPDRPVVCEGTIVTSSKYGSFASHDNEVSGTYPTDKQCTIIISGDRPDEQIYINVIQNDLSPPSDRCGVDGDYLEISTDPVTWLCERSRGHFSSSSNQVTVNFNSDQLDNANREGFTFTYAVYYTDPYGCEEGYFMCSNERCIVQELVCDGLNHCDDNSDESESACGEGFSFGWIIVIILLLVCGCPCCFCICICINVTTQKPKRNGNTNNDTVLFANIDPPPYSARATPATVSGSVPQNRVPAAPSNIYNHPPSNVTLHLPPPVVQTPDQVTASALGLGDRKQPRNNMLPPLNGTAKY